MPKKIVDALKKKGYSEEKAHKIAYSAESKKKKSKRGKKT